MSKKNFKIWMVRAGSGSFLIDEFLDEEIATIGWNELKKLPHGITYQALKDKFKETYPDDSDGRVNQSVGQIWRLFSDFKIGDKVITYDSNTRVYYLGEIKSNYKYSEDFTYHHYRKVEWYDGAVERDLLKVRSKNTLGSTLTIFEIVLDIWNDLIENHPGYVSEEDWQEAKQMAEIFKKDEQEDVSRKTSSFEEELDDLRKDVVSKSTEFIKDIIVTLSWQDSERLVAGVMRAMGYKTRLTDKGPDMGSDIIASPDGLEMVEPIIKVEVKHRKTSKDKVGAPDLRNFIGGLRPPTKGIYVSTTGFSKDAKIEADRSNFQVTLVDLDRLVELIMEYYESLDQETKALVPLRKIYWPI